MNTTATPNGRSLVDILNEMKEELQQFVQTRIELLKRELQEKFATVKATLPLLAAGALLLTIAFLLFSFALAGLFAGVFAGNPYRWFFGFLIVGFLWLVLGVIAAMIAMRQLTARKLMPRKTISVLHDDKAWIQQEAKVI